MHEVLPRDIAAWRRHSALPPPLVCLVLLRPPGEEALPWCRAWLLLVLDCPSCEEMGGHFNAFYTLCQIVGAAETMTPANKAGSSAAAGTFLSGTYRSSPSDLTWFPSLTSRSTEL